MLINQNIGLQFRQSINITSEFVQSIQMLQFSHEDLFEFVKEQVDKNPVLKLEDTPPTPVSPVQYQFDHRYNQSSFGGSGSGESYQSFSETVAASESFYEKIMRQIQIEISDPKQRQIAFAIVSNLEPDGYLLRPIENIADMQDVSIAQAEVVLQRIQDLDPIGVGARNLAEFFRIQLREAGALTKRNSLLLDNLNLLEKRDVRGLSKLCGCSVDEVAIEVRKLRKLRLKPVSDLHPVQIQPALPDVILERSADGELKVLLNPSLVPRVLIDRDYYVSISKMTKGKKESFFVTECVKSARRIVRNLDQRSKTIVRVASEIVTHQLAFFEGRTNALKPLSLKDVGDVLNMHESTICRAISNKYILTDKGMFALRSFFTNAVGDGTGDSETSSATVRDTIKTILLTERNSTVLSDDDIASALKDKGIIVARRTVAKYRTMLGIPSSNQRRRQMSLEQAGCVF